MVLKTHKCIYCLYSISIYIFTLKVFLGVLMISDEEIKGKILHKMSRKGKFSASHTSVDNLPKGFPAHEIGRVKAIVKEMKREGLFIVKPTFYGEQVSINLERPEDVLRLIHVFLRSKEML